MTVCIATIRHDQDDKWCLITAPDGRLSLYGGLFSQDGAVVKFSNIHPEWLLMFAGDASEAVPLLDAVWKAMRGLKRNVRQEVVRRCCIA
jgi:hypothetical protein